MNEEELVSKLLGDSHSFVEPIGEGGYGKVLLVEDRKMGRREALKVLRSELTANSRILFEQEARIVAGLTKGDEGFQGVPPIFRFGTHNGHMFFTSPFYPGGNLRDFLKENKKLGLEDQLIIVEDVADILHYVHGKGVVHRDIKPSNILMTPEGSRRVVVTDFGISQLSDQEEGSKGLSDFARSLGTRDYMAPEQARGQGDARSDVYSLGVVLYEMLTGHVPRQIQSMMGLPEGRISFPSDINVKHDNRLISIVRESLTEDPDQRFQTALELKEAIHDYRVVRPRRKAIGTTVGLVLGAGAVLLGMHVADQREKEILAEKRKREIRRLKRERYEQSLEYTLEKIESTSPDDIDALQPLYAELAHRIANERLRRTVASVNERITEGKKETIPYAIQSGSLEWMLANQSYWGSGKWGSMLLDSYLITKDERFKKEAFKALGRMAFDPTDDFSFNAVRFYDSHVKGYGIQKDPRLKRKALRAAEKILGRFNPQGKFIHMDSGDIERINQHHVYVDSMIGLPLLQWAHEQTSEEKYKRAVLEHCDTVRKHNVNPDGAVVQIVSIDPLTNQSRGGVQSQGYSGDSCLARSQARAMLGFSEVYEAYQRPEDLASAELAAKYYLDNLPRDFVPLYDFKDPRRTIPKDTSAAAIALEALFKLHDLTGKTRYRQAAYRTLHSLCSKNHFAREAGYEGILLKGCSDYTRGICTEASLIYGDSPFVKTLTKQFVK